MYGKRVVRSKECDHSCCIRCSTHAWRYFCASVCISGWVRGTRAPQGVASLFSGRQTFGRGRVLGAGARPWEGTVQPGYPLFGGSGSGRRSFSPLALDGGTISGTNCRDAWSVDLICLGRSFREIRILFGGTRRTHNAGVAGSSPAPAIGGSPRRPMGYGDFSFLH